MLSRPSCQEQVTSQEKCKTCMNSVYMANFMALVVLIDAVCTVADIDATAQQQQSGDLVQVISDLCLTAYSLEAGGGSCSVDQSNLRSSQASGIISNSEPFQFHQFCSPFWGMNRLDFTSLPCHRWARWARWAR